MWPLSGAGCCAFSVRFEYYFVFTSLSLIFLWRSYNPTFHLVISNWHYSAAVLYIQLVLSVVMTTRVHRGVLLITDSASSVAEKVCVSVWHQPSPYPFLILRSTSSTMTWHILFATLSKQTVRSTSWLSLLMILKMKAEKWSQEVSVFFSSPTDNIVFQS